jgi:diadenosine tetraphosphatase ApaH/serine/threonine PP2A family protein phosphatase
MNLNLTYFGHNNFSPGKKRIRRQAENFGVFSSIREYGEDDLNDKSFWNDYAQHMMQERIGMPGKFYGYYACKPYFVEKALNEIEENDVLLYVDSGCELNKNGLPKLEQYYQECLNTNGLFFSLDLPECQWTKMDTYRRIMKEDDEYLMTRQIISGIFLLRNNSITRELVGKWKDICVEEGGHYLDDSPSELPNDLIFRENRHDQSILSLLVKNYSEKYDFTFYEDDTYEEIWQKNGLEGLPVGSGQARVWNTYGREFPIWATRNGQIDFTNCEV